MQKPKAFTSPVPGPDKNKIIRKEVVNKLTLMHSDAFCQFLTVVQKRAPDDSDTIMTRSFETFIQWKCFC